jgi:hypothetical protein
MANDKSMELRVALQEHQMETLVEIVRDIQANYVTKAELKESMADFKSYVDQRFASKEDLSRFATKEDLLRFATKEDLSRFATKEDLSHFATKEDLERAQQSTRNWMITVMLSVTALQFAMQYAMFQLYTQIR